MKKYTVSFPLDEKLKQIKSDAVHKFTLATWYRYMQPYIPFQNGILMDDVSIEDDGIHFNQPYAHYLYRGILMVGKESKSSWAKKDEEKEDANPITPLKYSHEQHPLACAEWGKVSADLYGDAIAKEIKNYILSLK